MNEINKYGLLNSLISLVNSSEEDDSKAVIARYMLENFNHLDKINIYDAAEECYVTRASIRRFCQSLGFDNFRALKTDPLEQGYYLNETTAHDYSQYLLERISIMMRDCADCFTRDMEKIFHSLDRAERLVFLATDIYSHRCIEFQKHMILQGRMVRLVDHRFQGNQLLDSLKEKDLLVVVSVTGGLAESINALVCNFPCRKALMTAVSVVHLQDTYDEIWHLSSGAVEENKDIYRHFVLEFYLDILYHAYMDHRRGVAGTE